MAKVKNPKKLPKKNYFRLFIQFYLKIRLSFEEHPLGFGLILFVGLLFAIPIFVPKLQTDFHYLLEIFKSEKLKDISSYRKENVSKKPFTFLALFHTSHQFYSGKLKISRDEYYDKIELSSDSLYLNLAPESTECGAKYVLVNHIFDTDTVHEILPEIPFSNEQKGEFSYLDNYLSEANASDSSENDDKDDDQVSRQQQVPCSVTDINAKESANTNIESFSKYDNPRLALLRTNSISICTGYLTSTIFLKCFS